MTDNDQLIMVLVDATVKNEHFGCKFHDEIKTGTGTIYFITQYKNLYRVHLPPCSMSESVRCVREKLAMLAGEIEKRE